ncbi:NIPSNAP family protein [Antarcticibacterium sp. 1MA-6-2]|uniref:NIPSNAP family protein n=1 Tax=Antarcticibacterium sp. 1MA-6-2 TaxID=2908210 RepID=UPI001F314D33|nr:NIPSNAP family protein [Antarcticibacterium sp. 1MA-6-2]UJH91223.1 NIPSNAP family protein [Antarcticibacterium sp. 1MA-6-2]
MPQMKPSTLTSAREKRIYELRSYQAPTEAYLQNKIEMFNEGGEIKLFDELGFNAVFYGEVIVSPHMPNLMYLTTFEDQESRDLHWKNFGDSPVWHKMSALEKYKDNVSHIDINFLYPTEYSDY